MANIKGITIEIDGNTQPLSNALKDLNKDINSVNKELKNVDQALKLDPGNAEQVARKLELLEEKAGLAEEKVQRLKQAQEKMDAEGVDHASDEYQALATEIAKAEGAYKDITTQIERTAKSFDEVTEGSKELQTFFDATGQSAEDLVDIIGAGLVDAIKSGQLGAAGYQTVLKKLAAEFTGSAKNVEEFRQVLASVDDGGSLDQVLADLQAIGQTDISGLGAEFDQLKQQSSGIDAELKAINQSLKLDPSSIELCAQKQAVLSEAVATSEEKLQILNQRFDELQTSGLDLGDEEFRELQREILNTETSLQTYQSQLSNLEQAQNRLNTYFQATGTSVDNFADILGSELVHHIQNGEASSQELAQALDQIGNAATQNGGDLDHFNQILDQIGSGVSLNHIASELQQLGGEFNEAEGEADEFQDSLGQIAENTAASALSDIGDSIGEVGEAFSGFAESAMEAAGEVQSSQAQIQMSLGMTDEQAAAMSEHVKNVWSQNFGETQEDVTEVMINIQKSISDVNDSNIEDITAKFITLQDMGIDSEQAISGVSSAMSAFGMTSDQALDMITQGFQTIRDPAQELGDVVNEYSPQFKQAGYSAEEMMSVLKAGGDAGARSLDLVADLIKEMGIRLSDGSITQAVGDLDAQFEGMGVSFSGVMQQMTEAGASPKETFNALVAEIDKLPTDMDKASAASALFGTQAEDATMPVIDAIAQAGEKFGDFSGAATDAAEANETSVGSMQRKWEELGQAFAPIGEDLAEIANTILDVLVPAVEKMVEWFTNLPEPVQKIIEIVGMLVAGLTALAPIIAGIVSVCTTLGPIIGAIGTALGAVTAVISGPVIAVIAAVVAAVVGLIAVFNNWGGCADWLKEKWAEFTQWCSEVFGGLWDSIKEAWETFKTNVTEVWNGIWTGIQEKWNETWTWLTGIFSGIWDGIKESWETFKTNVTEVWTGIWTGIQEKWNEEWTWLTGIFGGIWDGIKGSWETFTGNIKTGWETMTTNLQTTWDTTKQNLEGKFDEISKNLTQTWDTLKTNLGQIWDTLRTDLEQKWTTFKENVSQITETIRSNLSEKWESLRQNAQEKWESIRSSIQGKVEEMRTNIQAKWGEITSNLTQIWGDIKTKAGAKFEEIKTTITGKVDSIRTGIKGIWDRIVSDVTSVFRTLKRKLEEIWESIKSIFSWDNITSGISNMFGGWFGISNPLNIAPVIAVPKVDWFAKGGILTKPQLIGAGEAGPEAVIPLDKISDYMNNTETNDRLDTLINLMTQLLEKDSDIYLDSGALVGATAKEMNNQLGLITRRQRRQ